MVGSGTVSIEEWAAGVARQIHEGLWQYGSLFDFTAVEALAGFDHGPMLSDLHEMAADHGVRGPVALVAVSSGVYANFSRYEATATSLPYKTKAFRDVQLAEEWLERELTRPRATA
jgi:hypothetical protein